MAERPKVRGVFPVYIRKRIGDGVMGKGNSICLQHQRCWEFAFQHIPPVIVTTWGSTGDQSRVKMHEEIKGIRCSLVLFNWVPVTGLTFLNTPNSPPANTFPPDAVP